MAPIGFLETGVIYCDDNLHRLSQFPAECIDLVYLDPPFFSNRHYEVIWGDEAEVRSFEDRWQGGIQVYVNWMQERMLELHRILKPTGSIYLHCDWHASHYLKVMMDEVFGRPNFINEVIWYYGPKATQRVSSFQHKHDTIFLYGTQLGHHTFNLQLQEYGEGSLAERRTRYDQGDDRGPYRMTTRRTGDGSKVRAKVYLKSGVPMTDVWDIPVINSTSKERLGYPTQKPEALMERIVLASSNHGDIVLDPFCGCGTTLVAAQRLGRQWIGIDISPTAVNLMKRRLERIGTTDIKLVGMPVTEAQLHALKPFEFQNWVIDRINGTHSPRKSGDMGIDGFSFMLHEPIQVKQSDGIGRNVVDNFETAVKRVGHVKGYIMAFSFGRGAYEEVARARAEAGLDIRLVKVSDLLADKADLVTPEPGMFGTDLPLPSARDADSRPSIEELIESARGALPRAAEPPEGYGSD
jgi:DNA modification methylase